MSSMLLLSLFLLTPDGPALEAEHARNPVLRDVIESGLKSGGAVEKLPGPTFRDALTADQQLAALRQIAGSERNLQELLRDSVTAPQVLRLHDVKAEDVTLRAGDLTFVLRSDLDAIQPEEAFAKFRGQATEAGNMRVEARILSAEDLKGTPAADLAKDEWFTRANARLLDRITFESTDHVTASRSADSLVIASRTDPRFGPGSRWPNVWSTVVRAGEPGKPGPSHPYDGGISYIKLSRLKSTPGALIVEVHFALAEPRAWFNGEPILRSKFAIIAQDQVRRVRRELQKAKK
jgi:hypothetical protein